MYLFFIIFQLSNKQSPHRIVHLLCIILTLETNLCVDVGKEKLASVSVFVQLIPSFHFNFVPELLHDVATTNKDYGNFFVSPLWLQYG